MDGRRSSNAAPTSSCSRPEGYIVSCMKLSSIGKGCNIWDTWRAYVTSKSIKASLTIRLASEYQSPWKLINIEFKLKLWEVERPAFTYPAAVQARIASTSTQPSFHHRSSDRNTSKAWPMSAVSHQVSRRSAVLR